MWKKTNGFVNTYKSVYKNFNANLLIITVKKSLPFGVKKIFL